ncbi:hypothetical protein OEZ85_000872 [Tetradesmus obliquus]|uniref:NADP-dependent oxidoreductase domain-containing protein n=1 Tax=Tetradesmus obliquus TaxID=3088 RepID=A0ABY8UN43_TETOB|nr:hypothetical protein OEZ85_000872 [Tetradesmus obliquus]
MNVLGQGSHIGRHPVQQPRHTTSIWSPGVGIGRSPPAGPASCAASQQQRRTAAAATRPASAAAAAAAATPEAATSGAAAAALRFLHKAQGPLCMPHLGLGLAALGRPGYINLGHSADLAGGADVEAMRQHCWQVLDEAWACGVRYFDAARSYGRAEEFLGGWLAARGIGPEEVVVGSKWGYVYTAGWQVDTQGQPHEVKEHTAANLLTQAAETDQHLGPFLDLYQIHSATLESGVLANAEVLAALAQLKAERGWALGLSVSGEQQAAVIQQALQAQAPDGQLLFDSVQATWNLLEQSAGPALLAAHQAGLSVIIKEAMANGRLTARNSDPKFASRLVLLQDTAQQYDTTADALALACVLQQPFSPMVLSGAASPQQLRSNFAAVELAEELPQEIVQQLLQQMVQPAEEYWSQRSQLAWN